MSSPDQDQNFSFPELLYSFSLIANPNNPNATDARIKYPEVTQTAYNYFLPFFVEYLILQNAENGFDEKDKDAVLYVAAYQEVVDIVLEDDPSKFTGKSTTNRLLELMEEAGIEEQRAIGLATIYTFASNYTNRAIDDFYNGVTPPEAPQTQTENTD